MALFWLFGYLLRWVRYVCSWLVFVVLGLLCQVGVDVLIFVDLMFRE